MYIGFANSRRRSLWVSSDASRAMVAKNERRGMVLISRWLVRRFLKVELGGSERWEIGGRPKFRLFGSEG